MATPAFSLFAFAELREQLGLLGTTADRTRRNQLQTHWQCFPEKDGLGLRWAFDEVSHLLRTGHRPNQRPAAGRAGWCSYSRNPDNGAECAVRHGLRRQRRAAAITTTKGHPAPAVLDAFFAAGYSRGALIDLVMLIGDRMILNYLHALTQVPVDFPAVPELGA